MPEELVRSPETSQPEAAPPTETRPETLPGTPEQAAEAVRDKAAEKYSQILSKVQTAVLPVDSSRVAKDAEALSGETDAASAVTKLVSLAETKGVAHAVHVARKMQDLFVLDTMHDKIADELSEALTAKGLIAAE